jgi:hypothetical protein
MGHFFVDQAGCYAFGVWHIATNKLHTVSARSYLAYIGVWFIPLKGNGNTWTACVNIKGF